MRKLIVFFFSMILLTVSCGPRTTVTVKRTNDKVSISTNTSVSDSSSTSINVDVSPTIQLSPEPVAYLSSDDFDSVLKSAKVPIELPDGDFEVTYTMSDLKDMFEYKIMKLYAQKSEKIYSKDHTW